MRKGMPKKEAMTESMRINLSPVFLTSLTTCIGLLALNLSDVRPFNDLGNISTIGVTAAFLYTIVLLPPLAAIFPIRASKVGSERARPVVKEQSERGNGLKPGWQGQRYRSRTGRRFAGQAAILGRVQNCAR